MSAFAARLAAVLMFLVLIAAFAVLSHNYSGEQPNLPLVDAQAMIWKEDQRHQPSVCPTPHTYPLCREDCPKPRSYT